MLAKTIVLAAAITLGFASAAAAQVGYSYEPAPQWSFEVGPAYPGPILRDPGFAYEPGYVVIDPGYVIEPDYNTGYMYRNRIQQDWYNQSNGINSN